MATDRLVPVRRRPPVWERELPYDWRDHAAIAGVSRCRQRKIIVSPAREDAKLIAAVIGTVAVVWTIIVLWWVV